jgi:hypothetical protein
MGAGDNLLPKCLICENTPSGGIADGVFIGKRFLCASCEIRIVTLRWNDEDYQFYSQGLRRLWA